MADSAFFRSLLGRDEKSVMLCDLGGNTNWEA
jgi:hypothetical protein